MRSPDLEDLTKAKEFGKKIHEKMRNMQRLGEMPALQVPGNCPHKERGLLSDISPVIQEAVCAKCGISASVCPMVAIP